MTRRLDVDPKMGRVLIFQHAHLLHSGDEVQEGMKYTMRSDLMYERVGIESDDSDDIQWPEEIDSRVQAKGNYPDTT
jgi:hypothetical protein